MTTIADDFGAQVNQILALGPASQGAAIEAARTLLEAADSLAPVMTNAQALNRLGMFLFEHQYPDAALKAYTRALTMVDTAAPGDRLSVATLYNNIGQAEERLGRLESAGTHLETSLQIKESVPDSPVAIAITKDNLASVLLLRGQTERAEALISEALDTFEQAYGEVDAHVATSLDRLARACASRGDASRARAAFLRSLSIHVRAGGVDGPGAVVSAANLLAFCLERHEDDLAREMADLLLTIGGEHPDARHHAAAVTLLDSARTAFDAFSLAAAERLAARACTLLDATEGRTSKRARSARSLLGNIYLARGDAQAAEGLQIGALDDQDQDPTEVARDLIEFGRSLRSRGRSSNAAARAVFDHAVRLLRQHPDSALLVSAIGNLGILHFENDEPDAAEACYRQALDSIAGDPDRADGPWLLYNFAMLRYHLGRHDEALSDYRLARQGWKKRMGERHPFVASVDASLALVHWARGDIAAAARSFTTAQRVRAPELARTLAVGSERQRIASVRNQLDDLYKVVSFCLATGECVELAASMLLRHKGSVLDAVVQSSARLRGRLDPGTRVLLDRLTELQKKLGDATAAEVLFGQSTNPADVNGWQSEADRIQQEIGHRSAFGQASLAPVTLAAVRKAMPANAVLLEYLRYPVFDPIRTGSGSSWRDARYAAMVLRKRGSPVWIDLGDARIIDAAVQRLRELTADPSCVDTDPDAVAMHEASRALGALIIDPVAEGIANADVLLAAPDGALSLAPFSLLLDGRDAAPAVIALLMGGRELLREDDAGPSSEPIAIVDPDFGQAGDGPELEPLPATRVEAGAAQSFWPDLRVLAGGEATVDALRAVNRPSILHLATHGHFQQPEAGARRWEASTMLVDGQLYIVNRSSPSARQDAMLHGALALSGANQSTPAKPVGLITAAELSQLDLRGTALVVLSACDTGVGTAPQGEEFSGLRRAFAIAGARSQLTTLWWVDDEVTAAFMGAYYRRLREGAGRAEALRDAQGIIRSNPAWAHPAFWAGFALWGDHSPLPASIRGARGSR